MGRARLRSAFTKPACGISPSICKAKSHMRIGAADKRNSNRDLRPRPNSPSKEGSQKPPRPPDSLPRLGATVQASASFLPDALTPLSPPGPAISGASPVGGMRDGENSELCLYAVLPVYGRSYEGKPCSGPAGGVTDTIADLCFLPLAFVFGL